MKFMLILPVTANKKIEVISLIYLVLHIFHVTCNQFKPIQITSFSSPLLSSPFLATIIHSFFLIFLKQTNDISACIQYEIES